MQNQSHSTSKTMALMFIGGAAVGTAAGLLLAPKSGKETRGEIEGYAVKVKQDVVDIAQRTKAGIEAAVEKGRLLLSESQAA